MKAIVYSLGIYAEDCSLWSNTQYVRQLLLHAGIATSPDKKPFVSWQALPNVALLPIKHHQEDGVDYWHWVVFKRIAGKPYVLDSASYLSANVRTDFDQMHPQWFIALMPN